MRRGFVDWRQLQTGLHYFVGGNSKVYGGVLLRFREEDFGRIQHSDGFSPEWPVKYDEFELGTRQRKNCSRFTAEG